MKVMNIIGIVLIALGVVGLIYGGITYTSSKDVIDVGSMHVQVDQTRHIPLSPIGGAAAVTLGVVLMIISRRQLAHSKAV